MSRHNHHKHLPDGWGFSVCKHLLNNRKSPLVKENIYMHSRLTIRNKMRTLFFAVLLFFICTIGTAIAPSAANAQVLTESEIENLINTPVTAIRIPGLEFSDEKVIVGDDGNTYISFPFLSEYIAAVYRWVIFAITIVAVVMLIRGGLLWILSAGDQTKISHAKDVIGKSVIGVLIAVGSYTILATINPELVNFKNLRVLYVQGVNPEDVPSIDEHGNEGSSLVLAEGPTAAQERVNCTKSKSQSSGIGGTLHLGRLDCNQSSQRKDLKDITMVIIHEGGRSADNTVRFWESACKKGKKCVSSHYMIDRDGTIHQLLDEIKTASHTPGWNSASIGIDLAINVDSTLSTNQCLRCKKNGTCTGFGNRPKQKKKTESKEEALAECKVYYTETQYSALRTLIDSIASRTSVQTNGESVRTHCNTSGNHGDPRNFNWSKIGITPKQGSKCNFYPTYEQQATRTADKLFGT
jgi:N-acetyl-anhydromuramyl-L-alanine amidase AmpD